MVSLRYLCVQVRHILQREIIRSSKMPFEHNTSVLANPSPVGGY